MIVAGSFRLATIRSAAVAVSWVAATITADAAPDGYLPLPERAQAVEIEGHKATVRYRAAIGEHQAIGGDRYRVQLYVEADLAELQSATASALAKQYAYDECGDRTHAHSVSLLPAGARARLTGTVKYEHWDCIKTKIPELNGFKLTMKMRTIAKNRTLEQSATICADISPVIVDEGKRLEVKAEVTCAEPSSQSLLGKLNGLFGLEGIFTGLAQQVMSDVASKLQLGMPEELRQYDPRMTEVAFADLGGGRLGLVAKGHVTVTPAQLSELFSRYAKRQ